MIFFKKVFAKNTAFPSIKSLQKKYDVIIHIGAPKSGTSALQNFLLKNKDKLLEEGLYYPSHALDKNGISGGHSLLSIALMESRVNDAQDLFNSWFKEAEKMKKILLLSSESFFNLAEKMKPLLNGKKILVIAYHREILDYFISVHNQLIKRHYMTQSLNQYIESKLYSWNKKQTLVNKTFPEIYQEWRSLAGKDNVIVRNYSQESFLEGKIEKDFISRIGLNSSLFKVKNRKINISYGQDALEIKRMINYILDRHSPLNHRIDLTLQEYSEKTTQSKRSNMLDKEIYLKLQEYFSDDEKAVRELYMENDIVRNKEIKFDKKANVSEINLQNVTNYLRKDKDIEKYLIESIVEILKQKKASYSVYKLAQLLGIENIEDYEVEDFWFTENQLDNMAQGKYKEADFLRDIAKILMDRNDVKNASKIIEQAFLLRPTGPAIIDLNKKIQFLIQEQ